MDKSQQILNFIRAKGPSLPIAIGKEIGTDSIMAGAYLASLLERKVVKVSQLKVGGSPLYYLPGQESKLQGFSDKLNPVDRKTFELLREKMVLREKELEPVERVSLKQLRDFAVPLNVKIGENMEIFWKWYLLPEDEAAALVKKILHVVEPPPIKEEPKPLPKQDVQAEKPEEKKERAEPQKEAEKREEHAAEAAPRPLPKAQEERKAEADKDDEPRERHYVPEPADEPRRDSQRILVKQTDLKDRFFDQIRDFFSKNRIEIIETNIIKKGMEIDMLIEVPSAVGRLVYFCKAKSKKRSNEGDLAATFVQAQMRKLPALYLTRGELTKKASEMLNREFKGMIVRKF